MKLKAVLLMVVVVLTLLATAAPAFAAPEPGLHKAHHVTMGSAGHDNVPVSCTM